MKKKVIRVESLEHGKKILDYFNSQGVGYDPDYTYRDVLEELEIGDYIGYCEYDNMIDAWFKGLIITNEYELITLPEEPNTPEYYDNSNGSIYKFCNDQNLNPWETDIIKRIVRCRKKGEWLNDLNKTQDLINLYKKEYRDK